MEDEFSTQVERIKKHRRSPSGGKESAIETSTIRFPRSSCLVLSFELWMKKRPHFRDDSSVIHPIKPNCKDQDKSRHKRVTRFYGHHSDDYRSVPEPPGRTLDSFSLLLCTSFTPITSESNWVVFISQIYTGCMRSSSWLEKSFFAPFYWTLVTSFGISNTAILIWVDQSLMVELVSPHCTDILNCIYRIGSYFRTRYFIGW